MTYIYNQTFFRTKYLPYFAKNVAEFVWKDACTFEGFPSTETELPPQPQGLFSCSVPMDVAFVVDRRLLTTITDVNNARAFLAAVVLKLDVRVSVV